MVEIWLRSNRRILLLGMIPPVLLGLLGWLMFRADTHRILQGAGLVGIWVALALVGLLAHQMRKPRVAYRPAEVLFYLRSSQPIGVPLHLVEAFFLGSGPAHLPFGAEDSRESANLVARLSQREHAWSEVEVNHSLGCWRNGYVVIRGTWCEPLTAELVLQLNRRLSEVTQTERARTASEPGLASTQRESL